MNKREKIQQFVTSCSMVFKSYEYDVVISKNKANLWHYTASKKSKKYVVYCAPDLGKVKAILKAALKKVPKDSRLVVICHSFTEADEKEANEHEYTVVTLDTIRDYGTAMIEVKTRD